MIKLLNIYIQYGDRILFDQVSITLKEGEKIGLIGRNGAGKSTLIKILCGDIRPDSGKIDIPNGTTIGHLSQVISLDPTSSIITSAMQAFTEILNLRAEIKTLEKQLAEVAVGETQTQLELSEKLAHAHDHYRRQDGDAAESEAEKVLKGLGFNQEELGNAVGTLSGGWKMRIELAKLLLSKPKYLLLDEPTNHLDIESIIWLEEYLNQYADTVIVVSHDHRFLDQVTQRTIEVVNGKVYDYNLSYSRFLKQRDEERVMQEAAYKNQKKVIEHKEKLIDKFRAKNSKAKFAKSLEKQLDKMDRVELDYMDRSSIRLRFPEGPRSPQVLYEAKKIGKSYGKKEVFNGFDFKIERGERIAFVGQNGQGKSTLAKILIGDESVTAGKLNRSQNVIIGYYAQDQAEKLDPNMTVLETMDQHTPPELRTKTRSILGSFLFSGEDVDKKVSVLSGGERARLALACMIMHPVNLLILDEPTHHLDIDSKDILKEAILKYDGTLLVVSHDRHFLESLTNKVLEFRDRRINIHLGDIDSFLAKRKVSHMSELELKSETEKSKEQKNGSDNKNYKKRKELQRKVQYAERDIGKLEERISSLETQMRDKSFFERPDLEKQMKIYHDLKDKLALKMEVWETVSDDLDQLG